MPVQQGIMSAYQLMPHTHAGIGQGGIIRNDDLFQGCGCFAYLTVAQVCPNGMNKILFDAERYDIGGNFNADGVNSDFTVPKNGYYYADFRVTLEAIADAKLLQAIILLGGATIALTQKSSGVAGNLSVSASVLRYLTTGQVLTFNIWHDHGANRNALGGDAYSFVSIFKIGE